jgi:GntR family histidine utilization transcriptional repressor
LGAEPLHRRIRAEIEGRILSGAWPPGHRLPVEHVLMAQFGCARMTVSKALSSLAAAGLIERRRKAGSFVAYPRVQSAVLAIPDIAAEVAARGWRYGYELLARRRRPVTADDPIGAALAPGTLVLALTCRHLADGAPFALEHRLIDLSAVPAAAEADFAAVAPGAWLVDHVPWTEAEHRITAISADAAISRRLAIPKGRACLVVERRTWRAGLTITFVRQIFRADRYHLAARFAPAAGSAGSPAARHSSPSRSGVAQARSSE